MEAMLRDRRAVLAFVGPALLVYTLIVLVPIVWSLAYTVFEGNVLAMFNTAFTNGQYGYGSTLATVLAVMSLLVTLFIFRSARQDVA